MGEDERAADERALRAALRRDAAVIDRLERELELAKEQRDWRVLLMLGHGISERRVANDAGISAVRVHQIKVAARERESMRKINR